MGDSGFFTLTYSPDHVPVLQSGLQSLDPVHVRNFLQRLRRSVGPLRYVVCGEYGDSTWRPHYHGLVWLNAQGLDVRRELAAAWGLGFVHLGEVSEASISYTLSYVLKRMTKVDDDRLTGRVPEFGRYSHGLGVPAIVALRAVARPDDDGVLTIPREFRVFGKRWPIPRYIRLKLREEGYVFESCASQAQEEAFVSALRACSAVVAAEELAKYRSAVRERSRVRSAQAAIRSTRNLEVKKHETL